MATRKAQPYRRGAGAPLGPAQDAMRRGRTMTGGNPSDLRRRLASQHADLKTRIGGGGVALGPKRGKMPMKPGLPDKGMSPLRQKMKAMTDRQAMKRKKSYR